MSDCATTHFPEDSPVLPSTKKETQNIIFSAAV